MEDKKKIAIIGATEFQLPLIRKAKELGYETFVYAWETDDVGEKEADHFVPLSVLEKEQIYKHCVENGIKMAASIGSDITNLTVNYLLRKFNKPCNSEISDSICTNKYKMRNAFTERGVSCPKYLSVSEVPSIDQLEDLSFPLIVKPVDRSGSRGVFKVYDYKQLIKAVPRSIEQSFDKMAIIEEYIDGPEYSCESVSFNGEHKILSLTKKYTTGSPHFIETGHEEPSDIDDNALIKVKKQICRALDALLIRYGASHSEFKLDNNNDVRIIEIGARMGGDCIGSHLVPLSTGYDYMKMVIDIAQGETPDCSIAPHYRKACIRFIMEKEDLDRMKEIENDDRYQMFETFIDNNDINDVPTNSTDRHGYYIYVEK